MAGITMDGHTYRVRVILPSVEESARLVDGVNAGDMLSGRRERDLMGTYYDHTLAVEPDPRYPQDYDQFFDAVSAPVQSHAITVPHGQSTVTYDAMVHSVSHICNGVIAGVRRWKGLQVSFQGIRPTRLPGEENNA